MSVLEKIKAAFPNKAAQKKVIALLTKDNAIELELLRKSFENIIIHKNKVKEFANTKEVDLKKNLLKSAKLTQEERQLKQLFNVDN